MWFEPNALDVVSGVTTLKLANSPEKHPVSYVWAWFCDGSIKNEENKEKNNLVRHTDFIMRVYPNDI